MRMTEIDWTRACTSSAGCVEVAWVKAGACGSAGNCIEVAGHDGLVLIRDSKNPDGPVLTFDRAEWAMFQAGMRGNDFDHIAVGE
jgi:hypothetical protein